MIEVLDHQIEMCRDEDAIQPYLPPTTSGSLESSGDRPDLTRQTIGLALFDELTTSDTCEPQFWTVICVGGRGGWPSEEENHKVVSTFIKLHNFVVISLAMNPPIYQNKSRPIDRDSQRPFVANRGLVTITNRPWPAFVLIFGFKLERRQDSIV